MEERKEPEVTTSPPSPLAGALSTLLSNPDLMEKIRQTVSATAPPANDTVKKTEEVPPASLSTSAPLTTDGLAGILSNPAVLEKLPQMMATLGPLLGGMGGTVGKPADKSEPDSIPVCRDNLLLALRPFLSPERRQAVDSILRISKLGEVLGRLELK